MGGFQVEGETGNRLRLFFLFLKGNLRVSYKPIGNNLSRTTTFTRFDWFLDDPCFNMTLFLRAASITKKMLVFTFPATFYSNQIAIFLGGSCQHLFKQKDAVFF